MQESHTRENYASTFDRQSKPNREEENQAMLRANKQKSGKKCQNPKCTGLIDMFGTCLQCGEVYKESGQNPDKTGQESGQPKKIGKRVGGDEIPDEFKRWTIEVNDPETEIVRKRSLMRFESRKIHTAAGLSVRAQQEQRKVLIAVARLWDTLSADEREAFMPTVKMLGQVMLAINTLARERIAVAVKMEKAREKAFIGARNARLKADAKQRKAAAEKAKESAKTVTKPGQDTEGFSVPTPVAIDPELLLEQTRENLKKRDDRGKA
jgi:hypothetical protein